MRSPARDALVGGSGICVSSRISRRTVCAGRQHCLNCWSATGERAAQKVVLAFRRPALYGIGTRLIAPLWHRARAHYPRHPARVQHLCAKAGIDMNDIWLTSSHGRDVCFDELARQRKGGDGDRRRCGPGKSRPAGGMR